VQHDPRCKKVQNVGVCAQQISTQTAYSKHHGLWYKHRSSQTRTGLQIITLFLGNHCWAQIFLQEILPLSSTSFLP